MADRVVLHIGMMKSGTTFIQGRLSANTEVLAEQGITFPQPWNRQVAAVADLAGRQGAKSGRWGNLVKEVNSTPGTVLISMEFLVNLPAERIAKLRDDFAGSAVHAVVTVRDLGRSVPAMWQEALQNRMSTSWPEYLEAVEQREGPGKMFWRQQGAADIVRRWTEGLGPDGLTIITVPPPGAPPEQLWDRYCEAVGISPATWQPALRSNESLGAPSALLMGLLNEHFADVDKPTYNKLVKTLGKFVLPERVGVEPRIGFRAPAWLHRAAEAEVASLRSSGAGVIGDLAELTPQDVSGVDPAQVSTAELLETAVDTLAKVMETPAPRRAKQARQRSRKGAS